MQTAAVKRLPISSWSMEDRPSDKMIELGTSALTDAELLSIVIGSGTHKASAVDIAKHLLADHQNNLHELGKAEFNEICETEGIGTYRHKYRLPHHGSHRVRQAQADGTDG